MVNVTHTLNHKDMTRFWRIVNHSTKIEVTIEKEIRPGIPVSETWTRVRVTGREPTGKFVILNNLSDHSWLILVVVKSPDGSYDLQYAVDSDLPVKKFWKLGMGEYLESRDESYGDHSYVSLEKDQWCFPQLLEEAWDIETYWGKLLQASGWGETASGQFPSLPISLFPKRQDLHIVHGIIQNLVRAKRELKQLLSNQEKIGEVLRTIMERHPQSPSSAVARVAMSINPEVSGPGNDICRAIHDIAGIIGLELLEPIYLQPFKPPE